MGASPGPGKAAQKTAQLPLRLHVPGAPGWGLQAGRKAETRLCKSTPLPWLLEEPSLVLRQIGSFLKAGKMQDQQR